MAPTRCIQVANGVIEQIIMADPAVQPTDGSALVAFAQGNVGDGYVVATNTWTPNAQVQPPASIVMWQAKAVLQETAFTPSQAAPQYQSVVAGCANALAAANALIAAMGNPVLSQFWADAPTMQSDDSYLTQIAAALGLSAQLNGLLIQASQLTV